MNRTRTLERLLEIRGGAEQITIQEPQCSSCPSEREIWAALYRLYTKYVPLLRSAAMQNDENEQACKLFTAAFQEISAIHCIGGIVGDGLALPVYELLGKIYADEKSKYRGDCEAI